MAHREFFDAGGTRWDVWEVNPARVEHELEQVRQARADAGSPAAPTRRQSPMVSTALSSGWLCFESGEVKRRLAPIPPEWESLKDSELARLCETAASAARAPRQSGPEARPAHKPT